MTPPVALLSLCERTLPLFHSGMDIVQTADTGMAILHFGSHVIAGQCLLISDANGKNSAVIEEQHLASVENLLGI